MSRILALVWFIILMLFFGILEGRCQEIAPNKAVKYDWSDKIKEARMGLKKIKLKRASKIITYNENRKITIFSGKKSGMAGIKAITIKGRDYAWKEIGLALLNKNDGELKFVKIKKEGIKLSNPNKWFTIEIEERVNGLTWNGRNTAFKISPPGWVVIGNKYIAILNGKPKEAIYVPYSSSLHLEELIQVGDVHLHSDTKKAVAALKFLKVESLSLSLGVNLAASVDYAQNLALVEHTDPDEFRAFLAGNLGLSPFDRVKVLLAVNGKEAFTTFNYAGAIGLTQFTNNGSRRPRRLGTWDTVRRAFPKAKLPEFRKGAVDHVESIKATFLLYDLNLGALIRVFGPEILKDKNLDHYLYAAHNCGIIRVINALKISREQWRSALRQLAPTDETIIFLEKIDYLLTLKQN